MSKRFNNYNELIAEIRENKYDGYETAVICRNNWKAVKYGSKISEPDEFPDSPEYCELIVWNNNNIDRILENYEPLKI